MGLQRDVFVYEILATGVDESVSQSRLLLLYIYINNIDWVNVPITASSGGFKKKGPGGKRSEGPILGGKLRGSLLKMGQV